MILKIDKNRDGKTGMPFIYNDYRRSRFMTQEEVVQAYQETLTVLRPLLEKILAGQHFTLDCGHHFTGVTNHGNDITIRNG